MKSSLALETSGDALSFAYFDGEKKRAFFCENAHWQHEAIFWGEFKRRQKFWGLSLPEMKAFAVTRGPGRFTGIRMGLAIASTWGRVAQCPLFAPSVTDLMAYQYGSLAQCNNAAGAHLIACLIAFSGGVAAAAYKSDSRTFRKIMPETAFAGINECLSALARKLPAARLTLLYYADESRRQVLSDMKQKTRFLNKQPLIPRAEALLDFMQSPLAPAFLWHNSNKLPLPLYFKQSWH